VHAARRRGLLVGALLAALLALWCAGFEPFAFPNNDYYSFERTAHSLARGELPSSLKRAPILPGLMALLAPALGGRHPELRAALLWNVAFSVGFVGLLGALALRRFGPAWGGFLALVASCGVVHAMALQPLVEPSLSFFTALAFVGMSRRSPWQYAAAAAAALSRAEGGAVLLALALANGVAERRLARHVGLAVLGAIPFLVWNGIGATRGTGAATYLDLRQALSLRAFALVGVHYVREAFAGWAPGDGGAGLALAGVLAALFGLRGVRVGLRDFPREAWAMLLVLALTALAIGLFGISKSRYVEPTVWIPLAFVAVGVVDFAGALAPGPAARRAIAAALLIPLVVGGALRAELLVRQARDFDREVLPAARWLGEHLREDEKVAILHTSQVLWVTDLRPDQVVAFGTFEANDLGALRDEMRRRGVTYAAYTWRRPARTASQRFYDERKKVALAEAFAGSEAPPGFVHVATLAQPGLDTPPAQICRLEETAGVSGGVSPKATK
jgi:hypothetical protein